MLGMIVSFLLGAITGILAMAILSGRLDDRTEQKKRGR